MNALATFPNLSKLIPVLGSNQGGEVIAAAAAIGRALHGGGCDWHDVAHAIEIGAPRLRERRAEGMTAVTPSPDLTRAQWCRDHDAGRLRPNEREFINGIVRSLAYGHELSERQARWLDAIARVLGVMA